MKNKENSKRCALFGITLSLQIKEACYTTLLLQEHSTTPDNKQLTFIRHSIKVNWPTDSATVAVSYTYTDKSKLHPLLDSIYSTPTWIRMAADGDNEEELPAELEEHCSECHQSLVGVERLLNPLLSVSRAQMEEKVRV